MDCLGHRQERRMRRHPHNICSTMGPCQPWVALPCRTSHALSHVDVTSLRTPKVKMQIAAILSYDERELLSDEAV